MARVRPDGAGSRVEHRVQPQVRTARFGARVSPMSAGGLLLRVVLMLSLLLNGLNAAMAAPMALAMAIPPAAATAAPPCHDAPAATPMQPGHHSHIDAGAQAPHDGDHCAIKDCLRSCAQQSSLPPSIAWLPSPPPLSLAPVSLPRPALPAPPLDRITRPPIG